MKFLSGTALQSVTRLTVKILVVAAATVGGGALVSSSVFAALSATASNTTSVSTGTLKLTETATVGAGFVTAIASLAPGDKVNRYVTLLSGGTLDGLTPTLTVAGAGATTLTTDAVNGLKVNIQKCSGSWNLGTGLCSAGFGGITDVLGTTNGSGVISTSVAAATLASAQTLNNLTVTASGTNALKITVSLPTSTEVTVNGNVPGTGGNPGTTIQGLSTVLTWTFTVQQRAATETNS